MYRCNRRHRANPRSGRKKEPVCLPGFGFGKRSFGPYPEPELVEQVSGNAGAGDARQDQGGDEPPERRHVLGWTLNSRQRSVNFSARRITEEGQEQKGG
jgi:hypothetical protein